MNFAFEEMYDYIIELFQDIISLLSSTTFQFHGYTTSFLQLFLTISVLPGAFILFMPWLYGSTDVMERPTARGSSERINNE